MHSLEELLLSAMRAEIDSRDVYKKLSESVKNFMLKDRLRFLAGEEEKHWSYFEWLYKKNFPQRKIVIPDATPVPLPRIDMDPKTPLSEILESAMKAEKAAHDFYMVLSERFPKDADIKRTIIYIASMEMGHYRILEVERDNARDFEDFEIAWPMTHLGP